MPSRSTPQTSETAATAAGAPAAPARRAWLALAAALAWVAVARVPMVLNAGAHLDSDLAVDGLTLLDATRGHWRWHYPGTPYMGTIPVLLSIGQAKVAGVGPSTLVSGGVLAYGLLVAATFGLVRRAYGPAAAAWSLVPLAFASTGTVWLSGRITGGHLLTAAWHAAAFAGLHGCLTRGGFLRAAGLGVWCGLGVYLDWMFTASVGPLVVAAVGAWLPTRRPIRGLAVGLAFAAGLVAGVLPQRAGLAEDQYDAYQDQFDQFRPRDALFEADPARRAELRGVLAHHARVLGLDCLPRLIAGHRLPGLESEPAPEALARPVAARGVAGRGPLGAAVVALTLPLFALAILALVADAALGAPPGEPDEAARARRAVGLGLVLAGAAVSAGFVVNKNIYNSDNYRYLVFVLVAWAAGFGLLMSRLASTRPGRWAAPAIGAALALATTADTAAYYRDFGWLSGAERRPDPVLAWVEAHPEVGGVFGSYWDVYRISFLTGGRVLGVPSGFFPNRYPEWSDSFPKHRPRTLIARPTYEGNFNRSRALADGGRVLSAGGAATIIDWP